MEGEARRAERAATATRAPGPGRRTPSLILVANRRASGVGVELAAAAAQELRALGAAVELHETGSEEELAAGLAGADGRRVVLLGGDGSVHLVANLQHRPELALIPAGRANNVARSLGVPLEPRSAARLAASGKARPLDVLEARTAERTYLAVEGISLGFLAAARVRYRAPNSASVGAGLRAGASALGKFRPGRVVLSFDGRREELRVAQVFVANTPLYAFGLRVAPHADVRDGRLDAVALTPSGRAGLLLLAPAVWRGRHLGRSAARAWRAATARLEPHGLSPVVADSVDLGSEPVDVRVRAGELQMVAP